MKIHSIELENIRSYEKQEIQFENGSTLLSGDIGCGKSTILLAVDFALFGFRKGELSGGDLLRHGKDQGKIRLAFEVNGTMIHIERFLKRVPNGIRNDRCTLAVNGKKQDLMPSELKAHISSLIGYSQEAVKKNIPIFRYSVYAPQEQMKQILTDEKTRIETLRKLFDVEKYGHIRANAKIVLAELRGMKREYDTLAKHRAEKEQEIHDEEKRFKEKSAEYEAIKTVLREIVQRLERWTQKENELKAASQEHVKKNAIYESKKQLYQEKKKRLERVEQNRTAFEKKLEELAAQISKEPEQTKEALQKTLQENQKTQKELQAIASIQEHDVKRLEQVFTRGICQTCGQKIHNPREMEHEIAKKKRKRDEATAELKRAETTYASIQENLRAHERQEFIKKSYQETMQWKQEHGHEKTQLQEHIKTLAQEIQRLEEEAGRSQEIERKIAETSSMIKTIRQEQLTSEKSKSRSEETIQHIQQQIAQKTKELEEKKRAEEQAKKISALMVWFETQFIPLMETIEKHVMYTIQSEFNEFFQYWLGFLLDEAIQVRINETFSPEIEQNGYITQYQNLSGGEKTAIALAYRLALTKVINSVIENVKTKNLLILDEPTDGFSAKQLDKLRDILHELELRQIIIVSHESKMDAFVNNVKHIFKENHISRVAG